MQAYQIQQASPLHCPNIPPELLREIKEQFHKPIDYYDFLHDLNTLSSETWIKCIQFI